MEASYDPLTGKVTITLDYWEARAALISPVALDVCAAIGPLLTGARPPSRIVHIPPRKRRYAEPAPEAEARARREAVRESAEDAAIRRRYSGDPKSRDPQ
jgi:hypothetical protein